MTDPTPTTEAGRGKPWLVRLTCCGRADGVYAALTWDEADRFRLSYTAPSHYDDVSGLGGGHKRSAIIEDGYAPAQARTEALDELDWELIVSLVVAAVTDDASGMETLDADDIAAEYRRAILAGETE